MALWYFLSFFIFISCPVAGKTPQYVRKGLQTVLIPTIREQPERILWKHEGNKVVEFDGSEERVYSTYNNRVILDWIGAELTIKDLRHEDTGQYELEVVINKRLQYSRHDVVVLDEVAEPTISCEVNDSSSSDTSETRAVLSCSAETRRPSALMKFDWKLLEGVKPGPELPISLEGKHDEAVYFCVVSNPLSAKNASFTAKDCYSGDRLALAIALPVCLVLLCVLCVCLLGLYCWIRRRASRNRENGRLVDCQAPESPDKTPRPQGNVAEKIHHYNQLSNVSEKKTPDQHGRKAYSAKKKLPFLDSPTDTQKPSDKESGADPEKQPLLHSAATLPSKQPLASLNTSGQTTKPEDVNSHHEEGADSDQVTEEITDDKLPETNSSGLGSASEGDSVGKSEEEASNLQSSNTPEEPGLKSIPPELDSTSLNEPGTTESDQRETDRPVSEHENESDTEMGDGSPQQPQRSTITVPASTDNTSTIQNQQDANNQEPSLNNHVEPNMTDPEQESKTKYDSAESEEHSEINLYQEEPDIDERLDELQTNNEKSEVQSGPNEEEARDEKLSDDENELMTGTEEDQDRAEIENKYNKEASESEILNMVEPETKEEEADPPDKNVESDKSGEDLQDNPKEDHHLNKEVPPSEKQEGEMEITKNQSNKNGEDRKDNPKEDQDLNKEVPHPENQDGEIEITKNQSNKNGEDRKDSPKEDQDLNKEVPHPENRDGKMDSREGSDQSGEDL